MKKVHYRGIPCKSNKRWKSCQLTSTGNWDKVTCIKCLNIYVIGQPIDRYPAHPKRPPKNIPWINFNGENR